jgi:hypothetical protein
LIRTFIHAKKGNYLCFFPSYEYMAMVVDHFEGTAGWDVRFLVQAREMDDAGRVRVSRSLFVRTTIEPWSGLPSWGEFSAKESTWWASGSAGPSSWVWDYRPSARKGT